MKSALASLSQMSLAARATGFTPFEFSIGGKWLELLKEIAPSVTRVAVVRDAAQVSGGAQWGAIQAVAPSLGVELRPVGMRDAGEIESGVRLHLDVADRIETEPLGIRVFASLMMRPTAASGCGTRPRPVVGAGSVRD